MSYENERRVKLYTRKTPEFIGLGWEGRLVLWHFKCEADVLGRVDFVAGDELRDVALRILLPEELLLVGLPRVLDADFVRWEPHDGSTARRDSRGCVDTLGGGDFVIVEFVEQQKAKRSANLRDSEYRERLRCIKKQTERLAKRHGVGKKSPANLISTEEARALGLLNRAAAARELGVSVPTLRRRHEGQSLTIYRSELGEYLFQPAEVQALALKLVKAIHKADGAERDRAEPGESPIWRERAARLAEAMGSKAYTGSEMTALAKRLGFKDHLIGHVLAAAEGVELLKTNGKWTASKGER